MNRPEPFYQDDWVTIYHGDSRLILPHLQPPDVLVTDPVWPNCAVPLFGCEDPIAMFTQMWKSLPGLPIRAAIHLGCDSDPRFLTAVPESLAFFRVAWLKFAKPGYKGRLLHTGDVAYLFGEPPASVKGRHLIPGESTDRFAKGRETDHPCPRKLHHVSWLVNWWSEPSDIILDPFMGSGTTLLAAKNSNRRSIGIEAEERFCKMAVNRMTQGVLTLAETPEPASPPEDPQARLSCPAPLPSAS